MKDKERTKENNFGVPPADVTVTLDVASWTVLMGFLRSVARNNWPLRTSPFEETLQNAVARIEEAIHTEQHERHHEEEDKTNEPN